MLKAIAICVVLGVVGVWAAPPPSGSSISGNSTTDFNKIHIVIELRKNPTNASVPEEVVVYQEVEDSVEVTTPKVKTTTTPKPTKPSTTTTSAPVSSTQMSSLLAFDSSEEVVRRPYPTYSPKQFPRYRPTISTANASGPKLLLMGNRPTVDFLKRHFPKAQPMPPMAPTHNVVVRNARRTSSTESASAAKKPSFEVVGTYKDGRLSR